MVTMNSTTAYKSWFLFTNIFTIALTVCQILIGIICISIILSNRTYRSIPNFLIVNTACSIIFLALTILVIVINMLQCDSNSDQCIGNKACFFRDYINDVATTSAIYSLVVQSIHRYLAVIYANKVRLQKFQLRLALFILQWLLAFLFPLYFVYLQPHLKYDIVSYVCVISDDNNPFLTISLTIIDAILPFTLILGVYIRLFVYVRRLRTNSSLVISSKRELRMAKRIFFLLAIFAVGSIPGIIFQSLEPPPDYQYRIYYLSVSTTSFCCLLCMFIFTSQVKQWLIRHKAKVHIRIHPQVNPVIVPAVNRY